MAINFKATIFQYSMNQPPLVTKWSVKFLMVGNSSYNFKNETLHFKIMPMSIKENMAHIQSLEYIRLKIHFSWVMLQS